jgi:hypothetical protein
MTAPASRSAPILVELGVSMSESADGSASSILIPPFSSDIHDYYVQCATGANRLTVSMKASPGAKSLLIQPTKSGALTEQRLVLSAEENQAIVALATEEAASTQYWIRCLPHDFSRMQMIQHPSAGAPTPGYYLVGDEQPIPTWPNEPVSWAMVLDGNGVPVWYFREQNGVFDVDSVATGTLSFIPWSEPTVSSSPFELDQLSPRVTTSVSATGFAPDPHELRLLKNGNFLVFTDQIQTGVDLTGYPSLGEYGPNGSILPCDILEVDTMGDVVWKWVGTDHFDAVEDSTLQEVATGAQGALLADPFHCNSIDVDEETGNLLVSARNMDSIFYIDRSSGAVLWKMGGASYSKDDATYVTPADPFYRQHDARLQPGWSKACGGRGAISLFDDETFTGKPARAMVYEVTVKAGTDTECAKAGATVAWQRLGTAGSAYMGSFRISADGSRVIGWGVGGAASLVFTEVDANGDDLREFHFTDNDWSYRSIKVPLDQLDLGVMRSATGAQ